jgi:elongation factor P
MRQFFLVVALFAIFYTYSVSALRPFPATLLRRPLSTTALGLTTADFKNGMTLDLDGVPSRLMEFLHVKPGKGSAFVRTKVKNLVNGSVQERTFRAGESVQGAEVTKTEMQYTYTDGDQLCFMNMESLEEQRIDKKKVGESYVNLMREGLSCTVTVWNEQVIDISLPPSVEYTVVDTPPNFKGNSGQGVTKPATLDCGAVVQVPMFIEVGEKIVVSTDECKYLNRAEGTSSFNKKG